LRDEYLRTVEDAGLEEVAVVEERGFGEEVLGMVPAEIRRAVEAMGIDVLAVARTVRSVKVRARKPVR
jgi:hypothetical protein